MQATTSLDCLPFDVFYQMATLLDDRDHIQLSRTNKALHNQMKSDLIARKTVENCLLFSTEGQLALKNQDYTYSKAVQHRFDIHEAVATASPYSVSVLAYGSDFLYNQGFLCYRVGPDIRLLNVHAGDKQECILNLLDLLPHLQRSSVCPALDAVDRVSLLQYSDGILVFRIEGIGVQDGKLVAIDMTTPTTANNSKRKRLLLQRDVPATAPVFVRHCRTYLWYGIYTAVNGSDEVWTIYGVDMTASNEASIEFPLDRIVGGDLGQSLCFEVYNEHLYAVSTKIGSSKDERNSALYHWCCHAPRKSDRKWKDRFWRREHDEAPINEMWNDLSIRTDEATGRPIVLECRREWPDGKSENHRTYYIQPLPTPEEALATYGDPENISTAFVTGDSACREGIKNFNEERPAKRLRRDYHPEYESSQDQTQRQDFIAARTKHRSYHLSASTFIDLVNDRVHNGLRFQDRLRLRTVSRTRKCPIDEEGEEGPKGLLFRPTQYNDDRTAVAGSEERFVSSGIHMWPSDDCPQELQRILCPDRRISVVNATSDERSLIYSISCAGLPDGHKALILISFDPQIHFSTFSPLRQAHAMPDKIFPIEAPQPEQSNRSIVKMTRPLYEAIDWGFWLR